jgi:hypothetical protein
VGRNCSNDYASAQWYWLDETQPPSDADGAEKEEKKVEIKIEKGVPLPDHVQFKQAVKEAIASLEIGDSFTDAAAAAGRSETVAAWKEAEVGR